MVSFAASKEQTDGGFFSTHLSHTTPKSNSFHEAVCFRGETKLFWKGLWIQSYLQNSSNWQQTILQILSRTMNRGRFVRLAMFHPMTVVGPTEEVSTLSFAEQFQLRLSSLNSVKARPISLDAISRATTTLTRITFMKAQLYNFVQNPIQNRLTGKHWNLFESKHGTPKFKKASESHVSDEEPVKKRKLEEETQATPEAMRELRCLYDATNYTMIEYGSSIECNAENFKWDLIYAARIQISVLGISGMSACIEFKGESTHCYEDASKKLP